MALSGCGTLLQVAVEVLVRADGQQGARRFTRKVGEQELLMDAVELVHPDAGEVTLLFRAKYGINKDLADGGMDGSTLVRV